MVINVLTMSSNNKSSSLFLIEPSESGVKTVSLKFWKKEELVLKIDEIDNVRFYPIYTFSFNQIIKIIASFVYIWTI